MKGYAWSWYGTVLRKNSVGIGGVHFSPPKQCVMKILSIYSERQIGVRDFTYSINQYMAGTSNLVLKYVEDEETNNFSFPNKDYIGGFGLLPHENIYVFDGDEFVIAAGNMDVNGQIKLEMRTILSAYALPTTATPYGADNVITEINSKIVGVIE